MTDRELCCYYQGCRALIFPGEEDFGLTGKEIDPDKIINGTFRENKIPKISNDISQEEINPYRMAARNGNELPKHIMDKIKKNQSKPKNDSSESEDNNM